MTWMRWLVFFVVVSQSVAANVEAQSDFWQRFSSTRTARAQSLAAAAKSSLKRKPPSILGESMIQTAKTDRALAHLAEAATLAPNHPGILRAYGRALAEHRPNTPSGRALAIRSLERARKLDPTTFGRDDLFELAILYSRAHRFSDSASTYESLLAQAIEPPTATTRSNLAEMRMLSGDLQGALKAFREALATSNAGPGSLVLARWGYGVALDRSGSHNRAVEEVAAAVAQSGGTLRTLDMDGVFFEPNYERHWYRALGYEALARAKSGLRRDEMLYSAELEWAAFMKKSSTSKTPSSWQKQAGEQLGRLTKVRKRKPPRRRARKSVLQKI